MKNTTKKPAPVKEKDPKGKKLGEVKITLTKYENGWSHDCEQKKEVITYPELIGMLEDLKMELAFQKANVVKFS